MDIEGIHIFIVPTFTAVPSRGVKQNTEENINASGIPAINNRTSFILHSLPNNPENNNHEGYLQEEMLTALLNNVKENRWLFLLGTSGSGKTRSLYELLCKTFGIYISLSARNGSKNLGSQDMDISIHYNRNFTPKQWLLMQLLPIQISGEDFWIGISRIFRELRLEDQDGLINTFVKKFQTLIPKQEKLPIVIDESQVAINKHEKHFSTTIANGPLRPFFAILLQAVLRLSTEKLCLVLSGTGMSFYESHES
ncbi:unnamed protein product [Rhizophagus irregularis]|nr:unnamed protein product [Rhizophagus irregularis]